ncbi:hypothetical protein PV325_006232 [Microctonus aethiopoides]|uniref:U11/U12 small nuclear ribonucleoprotein 35 kDa protein n=1 Tax=Microctonus aethiopoides TaxID=144406 RepID=A0AA39C6P5_9HYME|nr:hypothetical protein PV325_006232 [Microctonus aethiopoides]KAK0097874.1 hypothetical protein PV326_013070 [Microctonus aethiopoides]KAK0158919.1 hypothetical protein PV328_009856 [Microctonus aethiopoides]
MSELKNNWSRYAKVYDALKVGSIDGTDSEPHDKAISRAIRARYDPPRGLKSLPAQSLFVARFDNQVTEQDLIELFSTVGKVLSAKIIVDIVTGYSQGYGFVEMSSDSEARRAVARLNDGNLRGSKIFVDHECGRTLKNWKPRRLGGGFGGKKESGQLRFGGKDRPFRKPIVPNIIKNK